MNARGSVRLVALLMALAAGCQKGPDKVARGDLLDILLACWKHEKVTGRPPQQADDLKPYLEYADTYERLAAGRYVVPWGTPLAGRDELELIVVAWEKDPGEEGRRSVVFGGGEARTVTEQEFQALPRWRGGEKP